MGEKIKKYGKCVLIVAGVGIVAYAGYKLMNKSSGGSDGSKRIPTASVPYRIYIGT